MALTQTDEQMLKEIYQRLADKPIEPGQPESRFYENIYERTEGEDPVAKLRKRIEWADAESIQLFSEFRGAGKTTELFRLRRDLESRGFSVLYADALEYLSPSEEVDVVTLLLVLAGSFGEQMENLLGANILKESFWHRAANYLTKTTIQIEEVSTKIEASTPAKALLGDFKANLDLKLALKTAPSFRQKLQALLADRLYELQAQVVEFVQQTVELARQHKPNLQIVFLFDQFEQIRGSRSNEQAVIHGVEQLFANHLQRLGLPDVHVIYTVPPWLQFVLPAAFSIETLPCVRLCKKDPERTRYETGWDLLRDAVIKRFEPASFAKVFGDGDAGRRLADCLIGMSGGHFRDLLRLFRETIVLISTWRQTLPVTAEVIERAIVNVRNEYLPIAIEDAQWLEKIGKTRRLDLPDRSPQNVARVSLFLDTHLVLYLTNGGDWYDIHPLIRDTVSEMTKEFPPEAT